MSPILQIKVVPADKPNDDGRWITLAAPGVESSGTRWFEIQRAVAPYIPERHELVAVSTRETLALHGLRK